MLNPKQQRFAKGFLHGAKQRFFFFTQLPMALLAGVRLQELDAERAVATVPFRYVTKNPFKSMYFAVQSMAAELSTAAPALLAIKGCDFDVVLIIVNNSATYTKKAKTKITFTCNDYAQYERALANLKKAGDTAEVTATTIGRNADGEVVSEFTFTWSFKRR